MSSFTPFDGSRERGNVLEVILLKEEQRAHRRRSKLSGPIPWWVFLLVPWWAFLLMNSFLYECSYSMMSVVMNSFWHSWQCLSLVSLRIGVEGDGIYHSLIVHKLVKLGLVNGGYFVVFWIPHNLVGFMDLGLAWFLEWLLDFIQHILTHDAIIQLGFAFTVESESPHFTFDMTVRMVMDHWDHWDHPTRIPQCSRPPSIRW